jgi:[citrate (pro-3S)-lyase] ligase
VNPPKLPVPAVFKHFYKGSAPTGQAAEESNPFPSNSWSGNSEYNEYVKTLKALRMVIGAVVVNCSPFALGHQYLVETAAKAVDRLYVFVVEEDKSIFPFADRLRLVQVGTSHLKNVVVFRSGKFMVSSLTLPEHFARDQNPDALVDASMDVQIFCEGIAPALGVTVRYVGEEPFDLVTAQYNRQMQEAFPHYGLELRIIPRREWGGLAISATRVRTLLREKKFDEIAKIVPETTLTYLRDEFKAKLAVTLAVGVGANAGAGAGANAGAGAGVGAGASAGAGAGAGADADP